MNLFARGVTTSVTTVLAVAAVASCTDSTSALRSQRLTSADSARLGLLQARLSRATLDAIDPGLTIVSAVPGFFAGASQPNPLTFTFSGPVREVTIVGSGAISCSGDLGTLTGYDANGNTLGSASLSLISPADCGQDNVTFGAAATLVTSGVMATAVLTPMSLLTFPVFNLVGHASQTYTLQLGRGPAPPATVAADCRGSVTRGETVHCTTTVTPTQPYVITKRTSAGSGYLFTSSERISQTDGAPYDWDGFAVLSSQVSITVAITVNGAETALDPATTSFTVNARTGPEWTGFTIPETPPGPTFVTGAPLPENPFTTPGSLAFPPGATGRNIQVYTYHFGTVASGPNANLVYTRAPMSLKSATIYVHGWLLSTSAFYRAQAISSNTVIGTRPCTRSDIDALRNAVITHENLHYSESKKFFDTHDVLKALEAAYAPFDAVQLDLTALETAHDAMTNGAFDTAWKAAALTAVDDQHPVPTSACSPAQP
jgi:hypothetical protein